MKVMNNFNFIASRWSELCDLAKL